MIIHDNIFLGESHDAWCGHSHLPVIVPNLPLNFFEKHDNSIIENVDSDINLI